MNSRERVLRAMRRQEPDRIPVDLSWGMTQGALVKFRQQTGACDPADYFGLDVRFVSPELSKGWGTTPGVDDEGVLDPDQRIKESAFQAFLPDVRPDDSITEWGVGHRRGSEHLRNGNHGT